MNNVQSPSIFDLLNRDDQIDLTLVTDLDSLISNKDDELYQTALLMRKGANGQLITDTIEISARGKTRKKYCSIPPIKLRFPAEYLAKQSLAGFKTLKLVIPCREGEMFQDFLFREYLCYRLCQLVTGKSFRVQLVDLHLAHVDQEKIEHVDYAFIIEHEKDMARRMGNGLVDESISKVKTVQQDDYNLLVLFQYMIANTDWNLSARHNIKLVDNGPRSAPTPIPYDFDYCGLVNADYAIPHPNLPVETIRDRFFQWRGKDRVGLEKAMDKLLERKERVIDEVKQFTLLSEESRTDILNFLSPLFVMLSAENRADLLLGTEGTR